MLISVRALDKLCVILCVTALSGCLAVPAKRASMNQLLDSGRIVEAAQVAESQDQYGDDVLSSLNKGILRRMTGDFKGSNRIFERAKRKIDDLYGVSIGDQLAAVTINDTLRDYSGDRYEQVILHAYMALNYLELGLPDSARVEMLQADVKMREWGEQPEEDPFVRYLSGIIFDMLGEYDEAVIAYRKAINAYRDTAHKQQTGVPYQLRADLLDALHKADRKQEYRQLAEQFRMTKYRPAGRDTSTVVMVLNNGAAPRRRQHAIQSFATEIENMVRIALPKYDSGKPLLKTPVLKVAEIETAFYKVHDIDALARHALDEEMPVITARALARAVVKHQASERAKEESGLAGFITKIASIATEQADTRSWTTLPQEIQVIRVRVPAGQHDLVIEMRNAAGYTVDTIRRSVNVPAGGSAVTSAHWVAPVVLPAQTTTTAAAQ